MTESEHKWIETNNQVCGLLRVAHDLLACSSLPPKRTWVGLADEEYINLLIQASKPMKTAPDMAVVFGHLVEAKLKEKNNG